MISVVIPCYNAAATIDATLDSALSQGVPLEVVVVDDGSTDRSGEVLARRGDAVRVITTPNRGASAARTTGTEAATGQFIQYLDSDDLLAAGTLPARLAALERTGADVAHTDWQKFTADASGVIIPGETMKPDVLAIESDAEIAAATSRFWAPPAALLYRRAIVDRIGGWHKRLPIIQDARFLFDAAAAGGRFTYVPGVGALYRVAPNSLSRASKSKFIADCALNVEEIEALWRERGTLSADRRRALAEMWSHVATAALVNGLDVFAAAKRGFVRNGGRRLSFEVGHGVRTIVGARGTAALAQWLIGARRSMATVGGGFQ